MERVEQSVEAMLQEDMASFTHDPYGWVLYSFPWGVQGTDLADKKGPREWQKEILIEIGEKLAAGEINLYEAIQIAVSSGHGIGKSALVSWIILWALTTFEDTKGVVTANTETQLKTKTWAEVAKWHRLCIVGHWFHFTATAIFSVDPKHAKTWRIDMVPWSERNTEAFAGLHNEGKRILLVFDEASAIPDLIWEVSEGALTDEDTEILWCAFGNPTRTTGRFHSCFSRLKHRWSHRQIDSRTVEGTNKHQIQKWIDDEGEDSDFVRVRVRGLFPRVSDTQIFPSPSVTNAMARNLTPAEFGQYPKVLSVDVARFGNDTTVLTLRQGPKVHFQHQHRGLRNTEVAGKVRDIYGEHPDIVGIPVDAPGVGAGVVDILHGWGLPVVEVQPASTSCPQPEHYINLRAWMFDQCAVWLESADLPSGDTDLFNEMTAINYGYNAAMKKKVQSSEDIKDELGYSPDKVASLVLSFAPLDEVARPVMDQIHAARKRRARGGSWGAHT